MVVQIAVIVAIMVVTAATHIAGLWALEPACKRFIGRGAPHHHGLFLLGLAVTLLALHTLEIVEYAVLYETIGALPNFESSLYFSADAYSTIGGGSVRLPVEWRLVGSFEGVNGMVLIGWSTAFLFAAWRDILRPTP
ncbi:MAG TPA: ion channel [Caulobacteraceae bacterium]